MKHTELQIRTRTVKLNKSTVNVTFVHFKGEGKFVAFAQKKPPVRLVRKGKTWVAQVNSNEYKAATPPKAFAQAAQHWN